jgi:hypothetical protein
MVATILYYAVIPIKSSNLLLLVYCGNSRRVALFIQRNFPHQQLAVLVTTTKEYYRQAS